MDRKLLLAMLLAGLLISAPFVRSDEEDYDDDGDDADEKKDSDDEPHVKVITTKNWDETVGKAKFALVRLRACWAPEAPGCG
jgi:hypothetical protein